MGKRRFSEFHKSLGLAKNILCMRLQKLVSHGIFEAVPSPIMIVVKLSTGHPPGYFSLLYAPLVRKDVAKARRGRRCCSRPRKSASRGAKTLGDWC